MFIPIILWVMADGIAISGRCLNNFGLMLTLGRCYCLILADVIANLLSDLFWYIVGILSKLIQSASNIYH